MSTPSNESGVTPYMINSGPNNAGSIYESGTSRINSNNSQLNSLINIETGGGIKNKKGKKGKKGGSGDTIVVPPVRALYPEIGADGQTVSGNTASLTTLGATSVANSEYDNCVGMSPGQCGGTKKQKKNAINMGKTKGKIKKTRTNKTTKKDKIILEYVCVN